jgi:hypothetical protein
MGSSPIARVPLEIVLVERFEHRADHDERKSRDNHPLQKYWHSQLPVDAAQVFAPTLPPTPGQAERNRTWNVLTTSPPRTPASPT